MSTELVTAARAVLDRWYAYVSKQPQSDEIESIEWTEMQALRRALAAPPYAPAGDVGESAFESWFESYVPAPGDKQRARDAYAAGMRDEAGPFTAKEMNINWGAGYNRGFDDGKAAAAPAAPAQPLHVEWVDQHGTKHRMRIDKAAEELKALFERWPDGTNEMEASLDSWSAAPVEESADETQALDLLAILFDAYESGTECYEDPEEYSGFLGYAVRLDEETFAACAALLNRRRPAQPDTPTPGIAPTQAVSDGSGQ